MAVSPATDKFVFNPEKFRELIVYIAKNSADDPTFGAIKLNKILYYSDFAAYRCLGRPITNARYQKLREGPAPKELLDARAQLIESGDAHIEEQQYFTGLQKRLVIRDDREPDREIFDPGELDLVNQVLDYFHGKTAREASDISHLEPGWVLAHDREVMPYETAWLSSTPIDQAAEETGMRLAQRRSHG